MKKLFLIFAVLSFLVIYHLNAYAGEKVTHSIHYGPNEAQIVDVYQPGKSQNNKYPVVIWVHGGGWRNGNMQHGKAVDMMTTWAKQGIVVVGVNYRLSPEYMHPAHVQDVAAAINWVYHNIDRFGGDPSRISLLGHSAGAHLVALVATNPTYLGTYGLSPDNVISNVFPIDTASFDLTHPSRFVGNLIKEAFGTDEAVLKQASPIWNVHRGGSYPSFIIAATQVRDDAVVTSQILQQKLRNAGGSAELIVVNYPNLSQLKAHSMIANDLANLDCDMTKTLLRRVLEQR
jgi:acetyl esterase/lipase